MSWKHVFDTKTGYVTRDHAAHIAWNAGYRFLKWNDLVLFILDETGRTADTGIEASELV